MLKIRGFTIKRCILFFPGLLKVIKFSNSRCTSPQHFQHKYTYLPFAHRIPGTDITPWSVTKVFFTWVKTFKILKEKKKTRNNLLLQFVLNPKIVSESKEKEKKEKPHKQRMNGKSIQHLDTDPKTLFKEITPLTLIYFTSNTWSCDCLVMQQEFWTLHSYWR